MEKLTVVVLAILVLLLVGCPNQSSSDPNEYQPPQLPPDQVQNLQVETITGGQTTISWNAVNNANKCRLTYQRNTDAEVVITTTEISVSLDLQPGSYWLQVVACGNELQSVPTKKSFVVINPNDLRPPPIQNFKASVNVELLNFSWNVVISEIDEIEIQYSEHEDFESDVFSLYPEISSTEIYTTEVEAGDTFYSRIMCWNEWGNSEWSYFSGSITIPEEMSGNIWLSKAEGGDAVEYTNTTLLFIVSSVTNVQRLRWRNDIGSWEPWESYSESVPITLESANTFRTVYVEFEDEYGNILSLSAGTTVDLNAPLSTTTITQISGDTVRVELFPGEEVDSTMSWGVGKVGGWIFTYTVPYAQSRNITLTEEDYYEVHIGISDLAGNSRSFTRTFHFDPY